jgi:hypothetical protein
VTFYHLPAGKSQMDIMMQAPNLFPMTAPGRQQLKDTYHVDHYFQDLDATPGVLVKQSAYWYSMWSHRRNHIWKGFVQVDLGSIDDAASLSELDNLDRQVPTP